MRTTEKITYASVCGAMSFLLMAFVQFPIVPALSMLRFEPGEFPALLAGLLLGPEVGVLAVLVKDLLYFVFFAKSLFGPLADFIACATFVYVSSYLANRWRKDASHMIAACSLGTLVRILVMVPANIVILYLELGLTPAKVLGMFWSVIVPFNVVKSVTNMLLAVPLVQAIPRVWSSYAQKVAVKNRVS